jgi:hypothetical protein
MVLVVAMAASMGTVALAADEAISDAGIAFWVLEVDNPIIVNPGDPGTVPGVTPDPPIWIPPTDEPGVIGEISAMQSWDIYFHRHNLARVRQMANVTMQSVESRYTAAELVNGIPATAVGVPARVLAAPSRLGILVYMEGIATWSLTATMGPFTYGGDGTPGSGTETMKDYTLVLTHTQECRQIDASARYTPSTPTGWHGTVTLRQDIAANVVAPNSGGSGIHGREFAGALSFAGIDNSPSGTTEAQAEIQWGMNPVGEPTPQDYFAGLDLG